MPAILLTPFEINTPAAVVQALAQAVPLFVPVASISLDVFCRLALTSEPSKVNLITASPTCAAVIYLLRVFARSLAF